MKLLQILLNYWHGWLGSPYRDSNLQPLGRHHSDTAFYHSRLTELSICKICLVAGSKVKHELCTAQSQLVLVKLLPPVIWQYGVIYIRLKNKPDWKMWDLSDICLVKNQRFIKLEFKNCILWIILYAFNYMHCILCFLFYEMYCMHCFLCIVFSALYYVYLTIYI